MTFENYTLRELYSVAKKRGIKGYSRLNKAQLIKLLRNRSSSKSYASPPRGRSPTKTPPPVRRRRSPSPKTIQRMHWHTTKLPGAPKIPNAPKLDKSLQLPEFD